MKYLKEHGNLASQLALSAILTGGLTLSVSLCVDDGAYSRLGHLGHGLIALLAGQQSFI